MFNQAYGNPSYWSMWASSGSYNTLAVSDNHQYIYAGEINPNGARYTNNSAAEWYTLKLKTSSLYYTLPLRSLDTSADGLTAVTAVSQSTSYPPTPEYIYITTDGGVTWSVMPSSPKQLWTKVRADDNCKNMIATDGNNLFYYKSSAYTH